MNRQIKAMLNVTKKNQETLSALVRRFTQKVQSSGILKQAKKNKFFKKSLNRNSRRKGAVAREEKRKQRKVLRKLGKIK